MLALFWRQRAETPAVSGAELIAREARERAARVASSIQGLDLNRLAGSANTLERPLPDAVATRMDKGIRFAGFSHLPIADFDWPDSVHKLDSSITVRNLGDVVEMLHEDARIHPQASYRLALTPGGVHAFNLGEMLTPKQYYGESRTQPLAGDPNYQRLVQEPRAIQGVPLDDGVFWVRVSAKPARDAAQEFISMAVPGNIGALPRPEARELLSRYHDEVVLQEMRRSPAAAEALRYGRELLQRQIDTVNGSLRQLYGI